MSKRSDSIFRQGSWMMVASLTSSLFTLGTHFYGLWLGDNQYGLYNTLLNMLNLALIPALPLQMIFCQQTASAGNDRLRAELAGTMRGITYLMCGLWLVFLFAGLLFQNQLQETLQVESPLPLWCGLISVWPLLVLPVFLGVVQGKEDFAAFGFAVIFNGLGRFIAVGVLVVLLGTQAGGAMLGVFLGSIAALVLCVIRSREMWQRKCAKMDWKNWLAGLIPLAMALGSTQAMLAIDMIVVRNRFDKDWTGYYGAAGMFGKGMVLFLAPLVWVMFPKLVKQHAVKKRSEAFKQTLVLTLWIGGAMAVVLTLFSFSLPPLMEWIMEASVIPEKAIGWVSANMAGIRIITSLLPWFVWAMLPLTAANILINDLLARNQYRAARWLILVPLAYAAVLIGVGTTPPRILFTLFAFNMILLAVAYGFRTMSLRMS